MTTQPSQLNRFRQIMVLGALLYPGWWIVFTYFVPGAHDDLIGRLTIGALCLLFFAATYGSAWLRRHTDAALLVACYAVASHYYWLVYVNKLHIAYAEGCFVVAFSVAILLDTRRTLVCFYAYAMALTILVAARADAVSSGVILFAGLATVFLLSYASLDARLKLIGLLAASEGRVRGLFNATFEGIALHEDGVLLDANEPCARIFGYDRDDLVGRKIADFIAPRGNPSAPEAIGVRKDGTRFPLEVEDKPYSYGGRPVVMTALRDVSERRQMETRLRLSDRLASIGQMAAGVGHEINNPLSLVVGNIQYGLELLKGWKTDAARELTTALAAASEGADRVKLIVRDLKSLSRNDEETIGPVDVARVIEVAATMAQNEIKHRARLVKDIEPVPRVRGNEARLCQAFLNLLVNAAQAISEGNSDRNEIRVSARAAAGDRVTITVSDTGKGIDPRMREQIFNPFFTTKKIGVGTGLGLTICHNIIASLKGTIDVESAPGQGTTFRIHLPVASEAGAPAAQGAVAAPAKPPAPAAGRKRILIVDDEPDICRTLKRMLGAEHDVMVSASGREALRLLSEGSSFDLILCDLMMPDTTGMDVYDEIARAHPGVERRIVFMTGGTFTARSRDFQQEITNLCLEKPIGMQQLRELARSFRVDESSS